MLKTSSLVYKTLVIGVIILFIGVGVQPAIASDNTIYNEKIEKNENNPKLSGFWDIILFLLDLFEKILNNIINTTISLIGAILFMFILLFFG